MTGGDHVLTRTSPPLSSTDLVLDASVEILSDSSDITRYSYHDTSKRDNHCGITIKQTKQTKNPEWDIFS